MVGLESGCTAITSPSYGSVLPDIGALIEQANPDTACCNQDSKGYTLLTLRRGSARADFVAVSTVVSSIYETRIDASFEWHRGIEGPTWSKV